jgi:hypothetical protein
MTGALLFLSIFGIYLRLMAPSIALEDSGEFATAAQTLSLTHPPGYPVYILAGKLFSLMPIGSPGFRLSLLSAVSTALAAFLLYLFIKQLAGAIPAGDAGSAPPPSRIPAVTCAVAFAFAPAMALQAVLPDKYALNCALVCAGMVLCLKTSLEGMRWLPATALLGGIALSHHMQALYLSFAVAGLLWRHRSSIDGRAGVLLLLFVSLGLSLKPVALPLCSRASPSLLYDELSTASKAKRYLSARDYSGRFKAYTFAQKSGRLWNEGIAGLWRQGGPCILALAVPGAVSLWGPAAPVMLAGGAAMLSALILIASFDIAGTGYYLLPVAAFLCALAGAGLARARARFGPAFALAAGVMTVSYSAWRGLPPADFSRYYGAVDWGRNLLASLPRDSVLVTQHDDDFFPPMYVQRVLGEGRGIVLVHRPFITRLWYHAQMERVYPGFKTLNPALIPWGRTVEPEALINLFLRSHLGKRPVGFTYIANTETAGGFTLTPLNCIYLLGRRAGPAKPAMGWAEKPLPRAAAFAGRLKRFRLRTAFGPYPDGQRTREVAGAWAALLTQLAARWWDVGDRSEARACLKRALKFPNTRVVKADLERLRETIGGM